MTVQPDTLDLLDSYETSSPLLLASPHHTLLTHGARAVLEIDGGPGQWGALPGRVESLLADCRDDDDTTPAVIVGALPFDENLSVRFVVPESVRWGAPCNGMARPAPAADDATFDVRARPDAAFYLNAVRQAIARIRATDLDKVVLARSLELTRSAPVDVPALVGDLARRNRGAYTFAVDLSAHDDPRGATTPALERTLVGASPELLVRRSKLDVLANPLAGSSPRAGQPEEDRRRADALLWSEKDRREHAFAVQGVADALRPFCTRLLVPKEPSLLRTSTMWHLSTQVRGRLRDPAASVLELATALHPTPAVCGTPYDEALATILDLEGLDRGFYAGLVGWSDATGDGEWIVTLRCAEVDEQLIRVFAGAGIVDGSSPEDELAETSAKFQTMLCALGM
jgi:isochorismate synthase